MKDGQKDGYKCIYKRQGKGKDVTVFQPSHICQKSFKCKSENTINYLASNNIFIKVM